MFIIYLLSNLFFKLSLLCEVVLLKYTAKFFYIYISIIAINLFINLIFLAVVDIDSFLSLFSVGCGSSSSSSSIEIDGKIILKIDQGKVNPDCVLGSTQQEAEAPQEARQEAKSIESNNKLDSEGSADSAGSAGNKEDKCKGKNINPLKDIHKRLLSADKSHFPSYFQKDCLPIISQDVPVYGNKLVTFKPSSLLQDRNLPEMSIEIPKTTSIGKLTELHKAIDGADEAVKLYDSQFIKFNKVLSGIQNGTEGFYPKEAKPLMETYVDLVAKLSNQQKVMANEAISQLHKLDSNYSRDLYPVNNSGAQGTGTGIDAVRGTPE